MANLASLLQPTQAPVGPQVPLSPALQQAAQIGMPRAAPQNPVQSGPIMSPEVFQQKKSVWRNILTGWSQNPDAMAALLVLGHRLSKPRLPGETGTSRMSEALMQANAVQGRSAMLRQAALNQKKKMIMEMLKAKMDVYKAESGRISAEAAQTTAEARRGRLELDRQMTPLKVQKERATIKKLMAQADRAALGDTLQERWADLYGKRVELSYDGQVGEDIISVMKDEFRKAHDLPVDYPLGSGNGSKAPVASTSQALKEVSASPVARPNPKDLVYGQQVGNKVWVGRPGDDPRDNKNWRPVR